MKTLPRTDPKIDKVIRRLSKMSPPEMAFAASNLIFQLESAVILVSDLRFAAVQMMLADGLSYEDIGAMLGLQADLLKSSITLDDPTRRLDPRSQPG